MLDLQDAYARGARVLHERGARGDEHLLHIGGDLAGLCDRATWARRRYHSGKLVWDMLTGKWTNPHEQMRPAVPDTENITAMQLGHKAEALLLDGILEGLPDGYELKTGVACALALTEEGLRGVLFGLGAQRWLNPDEALIDFAERHEGVAIGHIDAIVHTPDWSEALVFDVKSTVWSDSWKTGERVWTAKYAPKESHVWQVSMYALAVSLANPGCKVSAGLLELDLGGKGTRWSPVEPIEAGMIASTLRRMLVTTNPDSPEPPATPREWTVRKDGTSWACGAIVDGRVKRGYCGHVTCPAHVLNHGEDV